MSTGRDGAYDLELINGGTTIGLVLDKDPNTGMLIYQEKPLPPAGEKIVTQDPGITDLSPELSMKVAFEDWRRGLGEFIYRGDPERGGTSTGADTSIDHQIIPGPAVNLSTLTVNSSDAGTNSGFELGTTATWSLASMGTATLTAANTPIAPRTGSYAGQLATSTGNPAAGGQVKLTLANTNYNGKAVTFTLYFKPAGTNWQWKPFITDDDGTNYGATVTLTDSVWNKITYSKVVAKTTGNVVFGIECVNNPGGTANNAIDDASAAFTADSSFGKFADHEGATYVAVGGVLYQWTGSAFTPRWVSSVGITDLASFGTYLLVARGSSDQIAYADVPSQRITETGTGYFIEASSTYNQANFFTVLGVDTSTPPVPIVYGLKNGNQLNQSVNPTVGSSWAATAQIGSTAVNFTGSGAGLYGGANQNFMGKADSIWRGTTAPTQLMPRTYQGTSNFSVIHTASWGWTYVNLQNGGLLAYDPYYGTFIDISPSLLGPHFPDMTQPVVAIASDDNWLYAFLKYGANNTTLLLKGRYVGWHYGVGKTETVDITQMGIPGAFAWHIIATIAQDTVQGAWVSKADGTSRLFWAGTHSGAPTAGYLNLPNKFNPVDDTTYSYANNTTYVTPWVVTRFPGVNKNLSGVHLEAQGVTATEYLGLEYQKWGDTGWTTIDAALDSTKFTAGVAETFLATPVKSTAFRFRVTFTQTTATNTPAQLVRMTIYLGLINPTERYVSCQATLYEHQRNYQGGESFTGQPIKTILDNIRTANNATFLTVNDPFGASWKGRLIHYEIMPRREQQGGQTMAVVKLTIKEDRTS